MRNELDIEIYKALIEKINASEIYLGHTGYDFVFGKTEYSATFTEAFPFSPFDKVICAILQEEENLSFHQIGNILGMNVGCPHDAKKIKDNAEYEILMEALHSLSEFDMIEGGDIYFSRCHLTDIGKEYALQKHKFRKTANMPFTIFFDKTTGNHKHAKVNFGFATGQIVKDYQVLNEPNGFDLKEIAAVQVPDIYNPQKLYSFTDETVCSTEDYCVIYHVGITFDMHEGKYHFYCYDRSKKQVHKHFSKWLTAHDAVTALLIENIRSENGMKSSDAIDVYPTMKDLFPKNRLLDAARQIAEADVFDQYFMLNHLKHFIKPEQKIDLYLCLPVLSESVYTSVKELLQESQHPESRYFITFPKLISASLSKGFMQLNSLANAEKNLYVVQQDIKSFYFLAKTDDDSFCIELKEAVLNDITFTLARKTKYDEGANAIRQSLLTGFSTRYTQELCTNAEELINSDINVSEAREDWEKLNDIRYKLLPFTETSEQTELVNNTLQLIDNFKENRIRLLNEKINDSVQQIVASVDTTTELGDLSQLRKELDELEKQLIEPDAPLQTAFTKATTLLYTKQEELEEQKRIYSFIIDTNLLLEDPEIIGRVNKKHAIIIAAPVLHELKKKKIGFPDNVSKAITLIQQNKNGNIRLTKGKLKLLPSELNQATPDNLLLSVAIQYQKDHGVLVTSNNLLSVKAKNELAVATMDLQEFRNKFDQSIKH